MVLTLLAAKCSLQTLQVSFLRTAWVFPGILSQRHALHPVIQFTVRWWYLNHSALPMTSTFRAWALSFWRGWALSPISSSSQARLLPCVICRANQLACFTQTARSETAYWNKACYATGLTIWQSCFLYYTWSNCIPKPFLQLRVTVIRSKLHSNFLL